jgi:hypothetical protein
VGMNQNEQGLYCWDSIPEELLVIIVRHIDLPATFISFSCVSKRISRIVLDPALQSEMKKKFARQIWVSANHCYQLLPNGDRQGMESEWHSNHQLKFSRAWNANLKHGLEQKWNSKGVLVLQRHWMDNLLCGPASEWHPNRNLASEKHYHQGKLEGQEKKYYANRKYSVLAFTLF